MDALKKIFPISFGSDGIIKKIIIYIVAAIVGTVLLFIAGLLTGIPVVGFIIALVCRIVGIILDIYVIAGIVLAILVACKVIN